MNIELYKPVCHMQKTKKKLQMQITQDRLEPYPHIPTWVSTLSAHGPFKQEKIEAGN